MKAAQQGHVESQYNVAFLYERGEGVEQNYAEAFFWYKKAADQGMAAAQHVIGLMYIYGRVVMNGVVGVISHIDDMGQIHLEGYGLAIIPEVDEFEVIQ